MYYCENVLNKDEVKEIYNELFNEHLWAVTNPYNEGNLEGIYLNSLIQDTQNGKSNIYNPYLFGLFKGVSIAVNNKLKEKYGFNLNINNKNIIRTQLNAQKKSNYSKFHIDGVESYSIIGFLTPFWDKIWGGSLQIENQNIIFTPGDFLVFKANRLHDALPTIKETPFYRVTMAMFINP